ncbi:MAG: aldehyde dehydrogenase [Bacteroidetes bacterium]|nr:aldehyde dehydrogenase [Bacteroidota bacterium]
MTDRLATPASDFSAPLHPLRQYFSTGATRSFAFRKEQLRKAQQMVRRYESAITEALYKDLKKSPEEAYATETGLLLSEIRVALKNLRSWMHPHRAAVDLANLPSSATIYRDPLGVVLIIAPWNYPLQLLLIPMISAIAGGNCIALKPSEAAPATAALIEKMIGEYFDPQYIKVVQGEGAEVVPGMMNAFRFDHIFYTGSVSTGKAIYQQAAASLIPVTLELGGKSPAVVEADADIATAARRIVLGKFLNAGQTCIAPDYILVHASVRQQLLEALQKSIQQFYGANAAESHDFGRIINQRRFDALVSYLGQGRILYGGQYQKEELYIGPTLIEPAAAGVPLMREEIFGPILPVISYETVAEARDIIARNPNPLAFYLFTRSSASEQEWINSLSFGGGCINNTAWYFTNHHLPFGGVGASGIGAYHGKYGFDTFTRLKPVLKTPNWFDPALKYPPFKGRLKLFKWLIR